MSEANYEHLHPKVKELVELRVQLKKSRLKSEGYGNNLDTQSIQRNIDALMDTPEIKPYLLEITCSKNS